MDQRGSIRKTGSRNNNPYSHGMTGQGAVASDSKIDSNSFAEPRQKDRYPSLSTHEASPPDLFSSSRSAAPTLDTNPETIHSEAGLSKDGTSNTVGGGPSSNSGGGNSIFSSSNQSARSLSTTLTTIQSTAPSTLLNHTQHPGTSPQAGMHHHNLQNSHSQASTYFSHQYPTTPASAIPSHLNPQHVAAAGHHPTTYRSATANNLLTDNASILTLASSSNRRQRRNSLDTNASMRAIAPSSAWGGSRESLPLSVFSPGPAESSPHQTPPTTATAGGVGGGIYQFQQQRPSIGGLASAERASVYSSSGIAAPVLSSERNSTYTGRSVGVGGGQDGSSLKAGHGVDGSSMKSGLLQHGRNDSTTGSIGGYELSTTLLVIPREASQVDVEQNHRTTVEVMRKN